MWTVNFQMFKLVLEKAEELEIKLPTYAGSSKKQESSRKTSNSALLTMPKPLTVWISINNGKFWNRWDYQTTSPASWESCSLWGHKELDMIEWLNWTELKQNLLNDWVHKKTTVISYTMRNILSCQLNGSQVSFEIQFQRHFSIAICRVHN